MFLCSWMAWSKLSFVKTNTFWSVSISAVLTALIRANTLITNRPNVMMPNRLRTHVRSEWKLSLLRTWQLGRSAARQPAEPQQSTHVASLWLADSRRSRPSFKRIRKKKVPSNTVVPTRIVRGARTARSLFYGIPTDWKLVGSHLTGNWKARVPAYKIIKKHGWWQLKKKHPLFRFAGPEYKCSKILWLAKCGLIEYVINNVLFAVNEIFGKRNSEVFYRLNVCYCVSE